MLTSWGVDEANVISDMGTVVGHAHSHLAAAVGQRYLLEMGR